MPTIDTDRTRLWDLSDNAWDEAFSNFEPFPTKIHLHGDEPVSGPTPEHVFQAYKTLDPERRDAILAAATPGAAKSRGKNRTATVLRPGWDDGIAIEVMRLIVVHRAIRDDDFAEALLSTGDRPIIEVTSWNDVVWGTTLKGRGANQLGQILMEVRDWAAQR